RLVLTEVDAGLGRRDQELQNPGQHQGPTGHTPALPARRSSPAPHETRPLRRRTGDRDLDNPPSGPPEVSASRRSRRCRYSDPAKGLEESRPAPTPEYRTARTERRGRATGGTGFELPGDPRPPRGTSR